MDWLPPQPTPAPAHKNPRGLARVIKMCICIATKLATPWDDSDDSFLTDYSQDDDSISLSNSHPIPLHKPRATQTNSNPYW